MRTSHSYPRPRSAAAVTAAFGAVALVLLLAACSGGTAEAGGDAIVRTIGTEPQQGLIPAMTNENGGGRVVDMLYSGLVYYDAEATSTTRWRRLSTKRGRRPTRSP